MRINYITYNRIQYEEKLGSQHSDDAEKDGTYYVSQKLNFLKIKPFIRLVAGRKYVAAISFRSINL